MRREKREKEPFRKDNHLEELQGTFQTLLLDDVRRKKFLIQKGKYKKEWNGLKRMRECGWWKWRKEKIEMMEIEEMFGMLGRMENQ